MERNENININFDNLNKSTKETISSVQKLNNEVTSLQKGVKNTDLKGINELGTAAKKSEKSISELTNQVNQLDKTISKANIGQLKSDLQDISNINMQSQIESSEKLAENLGHVARVGAGIAGVFEVAQGAINLFGVENEKIEEMIVKMQSLQAVTNGLSAIGDSVESFTKLTAAIKSTTLWSKLFVKSKRAETIEVKANTVAQKANAIAIGGVSKATKGLKAALISTGVGALLVAIGVGLEALVSNWDKVKGFFGGGDAQKSFKSSASRYGLSTTFETSAGAAAGYQAIQNLSGSGRPVDDLNVQLESNKILVEQLERNKKSREGLPEQMRGLLDKMESLQNKKIGIYGDIAKDAVLSAFLTALPSAFISRYLGKSGKALKAAKAAKANAKSLEKAEKEYLATRPLRDSGRVPLSAQEKAIASERADQVAQAKEYARSKKAIANKTSTKYGTVGAASGALAGGSTDAVRLVLINKELKETKNEIKKTRNSVADLNEENKNLKEAIIENKKQLKENEGALLNIRDEILINAGSDRENEFKSLENDFNTQSSALLAGRGLQEDILNSKKSTEAEKRIAQKNIQKYDEASAALNESFRKQQIELQKEWNDKLVEFDNSRLKGKAKAFADEKKLYEQRIEDLDYLKENDLLSSGDYNKRLELEEQDHNKRMQEIREEGVEELRRYVEDLRNYINDVGEKKLAETDLNRQEEDEIKRIKNQYELQVISLKQFEDTKLLIQEAYNKKRRELDDQYSKEETNKTNEQNAEKLKQIEENYNLQLQALLNSQSIKAYDLISARDFTRAQEEAKGHGTLGLLGYMDTNSGDLTNLFKTQITELENFLSVINADSEFSATTEGKSIITEVNSQIEMLKSNLKSLGDESVLNGIESMTSKFSDVDLLVGRFGEAANAIIASGDGINSAWGNIFSDLQAGIQSVGVSLQSNGKNWVTYGSVASSTLGMIGGVLNTVAGTQDKSSKKGFESAKKLQIASAIVATLGGMVSAVASAMDKANAFMTYPVQVGLATAGAASMLAMGIMQVNQIKKTKFDGGGSLGASATPSVSATAALRPSTSTTRLIEGASERGKTKDTRVYVLESDITSTQNKVNVLETEAAY